jgi:hypothetical protein
VAHVIEVDALDFRLTGDDGRSVGRNHAHANLRLRKRNFGVDVALN